MDLCHSCVPKVCSDQMQHAEALTVHLGGQNHTTRELVDGPCQSIDALPRHDARPYNRGLQERDGSKREAELHVQVICRLIEEEDMRIHQRHQQHHHLAVG